MIRIVHKLLTTIGGLTVLLALFLFIYDLRHSMDPARAFEVGQRETHPAVLIATQGSEYKDRVVEAVVDRLRGQASYVRVMDVTQLPTVIERQWEAILVLHTWEGWRPQADARTFIERVDDRHKLVVLTTSGAGKERIACVDAVTSASELDRAPDDAATLAQQVDNLLRDSHGSSLR